VADHHARERRILKEGFEPLNPSEVQMVGRLIEKQNVRPLDQPLGNHETFAPATRQGYGGSIKVRKTSTAKRLGSPGRPIHRGYCRSFQRLLHYRSDRLARRKFGHLCDIAEPAARTRRNSAAIRFYATVENLQQ